MGKNRNSKSELLIQRAGIVPVSAHPGRYASFSDETKTEGRLSMGFRASIVAQVLPDARLDWYYALLPYVRFEQGEIKSDVVVERFRDLPSEFQRRIRAEISTIRIHIFDPRPFALEVGDIFRRITGSRFPHRFLWGLGESGDQRMRAAARRLLSLEKAYVLDRVASSFPAEKLSALLEADLFSPSDEFDPPFMDGPRRPHRPGSRLIESVSSGERSIKAHEVDQALETGTKSMIVLGGAQQLIREMAETGSALPMPWQAKARIDRERSKVHVFDEGNVATREAVEMERKKVRDAVLGFSRDRPTGIQGGVVEMSSAASIFIQVADIAAGFARYEYDRGGLVDVVRRFQHVTFNGEPVNENNLHQALGRAGFYVVG